MNVDVKRPNRRNILAAGLAAAMLPPGAARAEINPALAWQRERDDGTRWVKLRSGYMVWTQRIGRGPKKLLLLHGGPGFSSDYLRCFSQFLPPDEFQIYYYDQLGCGRSERPDDISLWTVDRYREEVEEVRLALGLEDFILFGHSWGGILGIEYMLHHPPSVSAFVLSNMTASFADYGAYTRRLRAELPAAARRELDALEAAGKATSPAYEALLRRELYARYVCRLDPWPREVQDTFLFANPIVYNQMQGPNEFSITGNLKHWNRWDDLAQIAAPTLVMGARYDEMNPLEIRREAQLIPGAELFVSATGSHLAMWDDQAHYFSALLAFLRKPRMT